MFVSRHTSFLEKEFHLGKTSKSKIELEKTQEQIDNKEYEPMVEELDDQP